MMHSATSTIVNQRVTAESMCSSKAENAKPLQQEPTKWTNLVWPKLKKCTASTEVESMKSATPATSHDSARHTMINVLHVEVRVTGQDAAEKQNTQRKLGDKADIIGSSPVTISIIARGELTTENKEAKKTSTSWVTKKATYSISTP